MIAAIREHGAFDKVFRCGKVYYSIIITNFKLTATTYENAGNKSRYFMNILI
jgi:hypothetical protein